MKDSEQPSQDVIGIAERIEKFRYKIWTEHHVPGDGPLMLGAAASVMTVATHYVETADHGGSFLLGMSSGVAGLAGGLARYRNSQR